MRKYLKLLRISHYIKNLLIALPLIFDGKLLNAQNVMILTLGICAFSLLSSIIYIINDIQDLDKDKNHSIKCKRPIASGDISVNKARIIALFLFLLLLLIVGQNAYLQKGYLYLVLYLFINLIYSFGLKNVPILDLMFLVSGFLIRVLFGAVIFNIQVSGWLYLTVLSASLYLAIGKRRNEMKNYKFKSTRNVLQFYTMDFLDKNMYMAMGLAITFYSLWAIDYNKEQMILTIPLVLMICMKYSLDIESSSEGDPVEVILNDKMLMAIGLLLIFFIILIIY